LGINLSYFSAKYWTIDADSNKLMGLPKMEQYSTMNEFKEQKKYGHQCDIPPGPFLSTQAGIFELGFTFTNPLVNWSPFPILITIWRR
jgi:hypothetical protein